MRLKRTMKLRGSRRGALCTLWRRAAAASFAFMLIALNIPASVLAISTFTQGYSSTDKLTQGSIVSLKENAVDEVEASSTENVGGILGVVVSDDSSLLQITTAKGGQVQVATSGIVQVLVSDINGAIRNGDQITASTIEGVGMRATENVKTIGIVQNDLSSKNSNKETYKTKSGDSRTVQIGQVPVLINVSFFFKQPEKTIVPGAVQNIANALAGKEVNTLPILVSGGIFIVTLFVVASVIYAMIRSSIISMGRNPMSQAAIYRGLVQMSALVLGVLVAATASIYLVLTKL